MSFIFSYISLNTLYPRRRYSTARLFVVTYTVHSFAEERCVYMRGKVGMSYNHKISKKKFQKLNDYESLSQTNT